MDLVIVLRLFAGEHRIQRHLVALIHHRTVAAHHFADVKMDEAGDALEKLVGADDHLVGGLRLGRIGPKYDNV